MSAEPRTERSDTPGKQNNIYVGALKAQNMFFYYLTPPRMSLRSALGSVLAALSERTVPTKKPSQVLADSERQYNGLVNH